MHILTTNLSSSPYTFYKASMLLLYYIMLFVLEYFRIFSILYDYVICNYDICDHIVIIDTLYIIFPVGTDCHYVLYNKLLT